MKVKDIINKWGGILEGQTVTISEYVGISKPHKKIESCKFPFYGKDWTFPVDDEELNRLMNMTAHSFRISEKGINIFAEDKNRSYY